MILYDIDYEHDPGYSQETGIMQSTPWWEKLIDVVGRNLPGGDGGTYQTDPRPAGPIPYDSGISSMLPWLAVGAAAFLLLSSGKKRRR